MINWILAIFFFLNFGYYSLFEKSVVNSKLSIECKTKKINYHRRSIGELDFLQIRSRSITLDVIADNDSIFNLPDIILSQGLTLNFIDDKSQEVYKKSFSHGRRRERKRYRKELNQDIENCTYLPKIVRIKSNKIRIKFKIKFYCKDKYSDALMGFNLRKGKYQMFLKLRLNNRVEIESNKLNLEIIKG